MRAHRWQPTRLPRPWDSPGNNTEVGCHFLLRCMKVKTESEVAQLCPTLSDPMDWSLPGSSIHGIFQARVLEWGASAFSGYADDTTLMAESEEELKSLLMKVREEWKSWLKIQHSKIEDHGIWSYHFMANRWGNNGNSEQSLFSWAPKSLQKVTEAMKLKDICFLKEKQWQT